MIEYEKPVLEILYFDHEDVIVTSCPGGNDCDYCNGDQTDPEED